MNYEKWSNEYLEECDMLLRNIERLKTKLKKATCDEQKEINSAILTLRTIYYDCKLHAAHLKNRAEGVA